MSQSYIDITSDVASLFINIHIIYKVLAGLSVSMACPIISKYLLTAITLGTECLRHNVDNTSGHNYSGQFIGGEVQSQPEEGEGFPKVTRSTAAELVIYFCTTLFCF